MFATATPLAGSAARARTEGHNGIPRPTRFSQRDAVRDQHVDVGRFGCRIRGQPIDRLTSAARLRQVCARECRGLVGRRVERERAKNRIGRAAVIPSLVVQEREVNQGNRHVRPVALHLFGRHDGAAQVAMLITGHHAFDRSIDPDQALRIIGVGEMRLGRCGATRVSEAPEALAGLGSFHSACGRALVGANGL